MILSKAGRLSLLAGLFCLLLMGFTGAANAVIRWDVFPSPTEVINSGRSEVLGSITLVVQQNQPAPIISGNALGGATQIGVLLQNRMMIDNNVLSGIKLYTNNSTLPAPCTSGPTGCTGTNFWVWAQNIDPSGTGTYVGFLTINIPGGYTMFAGEVIQVDGIRGRIDKSDLATANNDAYAQMQSINDPAGNQFFPETIRIAKSLIPMTVALTSETATLCQLTYGAANSALLVAHKIRVKEVFNRAFVARDSNSSGSTGTGTAVPDLTDRLSRDPVNSSILGGPSNGTQLKVVLNSIPASVVGVSWQTYVASDAGGFQLMSVTLLAGTVPGGYPGTGTASAIYEYVTSNQAGASDISQEQFDFIPQLALSASNQQDVSQVRGAASLWPPPPSAEPTSGLYDPYNCNSRANDGVCGSDGKKPAMPRFVTSYLSDSAVSTSATSTSFSVYETFTQCVCYLLFTYTTYDNFWTTGIVVANTSDDTNVFPTTVTTTPRTGGPVTFFMFDYRLGNISPATGLVYPDPTHVAPPNQSPAFEPVAPNRPIYYAGQSLVTTLPEIYTNNTATNTLLANDGRPVGFLGAIGYLARAFSGYVIAKANFQYCHGYAFIADKNFATIAQGYLANVIPDPTIAGKRVAAHPAAPGILSGESINN